ncbi:MAG: hypothetical protein WA771_02525 [Chthoniobacterales bacterium]
MKLAAPVAGLCVLGLVNLTSAQDNRSLRNSENRLPQVIAGGSTDTSTNDFAVSDAPLYERLILLQNSVKVLTSSLANANSEAEMFKREAEELSLKLQALGIEGLDGDESKVEQRLIAAVRDLRLEKKRSAELQDQLILLTEAVQALIQSTREIPAESRLTVETEIRKTNDLLGATPETASVAAVTPTLSDGMVVETKDEFSLVVANLGDKHGVKIGMPFEVWRNGNRIGEVKVVDVREQISGAVIQNLENDKTPIKTGDQLRVKARQ